jgi:hypothetical protein
MRMRDALKGSFHRGSGRAIVIASVLIIVALVAVLGATYRKTLWATIEEPKLSGKPQAPPSQTPDAIHMVLTSASEKDFRYVFEGNITVVKRMSEISEECRGILQSSFVRPAAAGTSPEQVVIADPGQEFEATDAIQGGLPFRRLVFAGLGSKACFVYFERGGAMYPSSCLAVIDYAQRKALWIGEARKKVWTFEELRSMVFRGAFSDNAGPVC